MRTYRLFCEIYPVDGNYDAVIVEFDRSIPSVFAYGYKDEMARMCGYLNNRFPTADGAIKPSE